METQLTAPEPNNEIDLNLQKKFMEGNIGIGFCEYNIGNRQTIFSRSLIQLLGFSSDGLVDIHTLLKYLIHPDDINQVNKQWEESFHCTNELSPIEFRIQKVDQSYIWVNGTFSPIFDNKNHCCKILLTIYDIDKIKKKYEALKNIEVSYKKLFDKNLYGIVLADFSSKLIIDYNQKAAQFLGTPPCLYLQDFVQFLFKDESEDILNELYDKGNIINKECKVILVDGSVKWLQISAEVIQNENIIEFYLNDITESKTSILELQKINFELDNFVYHSSHDLKSPLKSILGLVNLLKMEKNPVSQQEYIDLIEGSIVRLDKLVNDLLNLSRNNRIDDSLCPINFMIEINNTITNFYHSTDSKNLEIIPLIYQPFPFVGDLTRIRIILNNVISNAIKYRSHNREVSLVRIEIHVEKEKVTIEIEDNGIGIPQSKLEKVFDMFYRASDHNEGSGLGLYIVKNVLNKINGTISLKSREGLGSIFTIEIPNGWNGEWEQH